MSSMAEDVIPLKERRRSRTSGSLSINLDKPHSKRLLKASKLNRPLVSDYLAYGSRVLDHTESEATESEATETELDYPLTMSELDSIRKALKINIIEDDNMTYDSSILNINTKVCNTYIPANSENLNASTSSQLANPPCCCGRKKEDQVHKREGQSKEWKSSEHTESIPSEVWGKMEQDSDGDRLADVLQLSDETDMTQLAEVLFNSFKIEKPGLIVSLLGDRSLGHLSYKFHAVIERSLPKAAVAFGGWILSDGYDGGLGEVIGDGIRTHGFSPYNIGITSWGNLPVETLENILKAREYAKSDGSNTTNPPRIPRDLEKSPSPAQICKYTYDSRNQHNCMGREAEESLTTLLMVDNGQIRSKKAIDDVIKFRIKFENYFAEEKEIPLISVLYGGGYGTIGIIQVLITRLRRNDKIIILAKTGGVASVLQDLKKHIIWIRSQQSGYTEPTHLSYHKSSKSKNEVNCTCMESGAVNNIKSCSYITRKITKHTASYHHRQYGHIEHFHPSPELFLEQMYTLLELAVEKQYNIFVFDVRNKEDMDPTMEFEQLLLKAMVENTDDAQKRFKYTFELGSPEEVEEVLLQTDVNISCQDPWHCWNNISILMIKAMLMNRPTMVNLFLKWCSIKINYCLPMKLMNAIPVLYEGACFAHEGDHLIRLISYYVSSSIVPGSSASLGLFEPETRIGYVGNHWIRWKPWNLDACMIIDGCINELAGQSFNSSVGWEYDSFFELTIWSVLMLRKEMALMFCQRAQDPIRCALFCLKLMLHLNRDKVIVNVGESDKLSQLREAFESLALCTLEACYSTNPDMTLAVARSKWHRVKDYDYLELAYEAECKRFIAHPVCQDISERRWRVGFVKDERFWTILLVVLFPPLILIPKLIQFESFATHDQNGKERIWWDKIFVKFKIIGKSPMIKFLMNGVFSLAFIVLHLRVLYLDTNPVINRTVNSSSWTYIYLLLAWYCLLIIEEAIQVYQDTLHYWWKVVWNRVDLVMYTIYLIGLVLCIANICTDDTGTCSLSTNMTGYVDCRGETGTCDPSRAPYVHAGRIILSLVTVLMFLRCSVFISSDYTLGPIVLMLFEMTNTFAFFFVIFCIVLVGFGAAYIGLLVQVGQFSMERNAIGMVYYTYFQSLGELFLDVIEQPESQYLNKADLARDMTDWRFKSDINASYYYVSLILLVIFMIISNLMLLNILIAMFTKSYDRISSNQLYWKFERYSLLRDYEHLFLPVPLSVIHYPLYLFRSLFREDEYKYLEFNTDNNTDISLRSFVCEGLEQFIKERGSNSSKYDKLKYAKGLEEIMNAF